MGKDKEKPIDVDETLNPKLGGFMTMMHDADYAPSLRVLPSPLPTVVSAVQVSPVTAAVPVTDLSGIAVAGNPAAIALAKNAKRPQFTGRNQDWVFFKRDWCKYVRQLGGKIAIGEDNLMQLLELALDEASQHNCQPQNPER